MNILNRYMGSNHQTIHHHEVVLGAPAIELERLKVHREANYISIESYLAWLPDETLLQLFRAVGNLPHLTSFRMSFSFQRFRQLPVLPIPAQALALILTSARQLDTLSLDEVRFLFRNNHDMQTLSLALQQAPNLKKLTIYNSFPVTSEIQEQQQHQNLGNTRNNSTSTRKLEPNIVASALAQMPVLEELDLIFTLEGPEWITALLKQSCCSPILQILRINVPDGSLRGEPIEAMANAFLERHPTPQLKELSIRCPLDQSAGVALARVLQHPSSVMQEMYLQMDQYEYAIPIARALHNNTRLKSFELRVWKDGDKTPLFKAYEEMLLHNTTIKQLVIDSGGRYSLNATIEFYLLLNRAGRRRLVTASEELTRKEWVDFLITHTSDARILFYALSLNPSLCQSMQYKNDDRIARKKRRDQPTDQPRAKRTKTQ